MMKKLFLIGVSVLYLGGVYAQKIEASKIPVVVSQSFERQYPSATHVKWEMENGDYEANFKRNGQTLSAMFKPDGTFTESEKDIKISELPVAVLDYVRKHYKGTTIKDASIITKVSGETMFEAGIKGKDLLFDEKGVFIKEVKD